MTNPLDAELTCLRQANGMFANVIHYFPALVYFEYTNLSGIFHHGNYLRHMERSQSAMLRLADIDQRSHNESGEGACHC